MKSCLGILIIFFSFLAVVGGGAGIWYLSKTSEFTRTVPPAPEPPPAPKGSVLSPNRGNAAPPAARPKTQLIPARPSQLKPQKPEDQDRPSSPFGDKAPPKLSR